MNDLFNSSFIDEELDTSYDNFLNDMSNDFEKFTINIIPKDMNLANICKEESIIGPFFHTMTKVLITESELKNLECKSDKFYIMENKIDKSFQDTYIIFTLFDNDNPLKFKEFKKILRDTIDVNKICRTTINNNYFMDKIDDCDFILYISSLDQHACNTDMILIGHTDLYNNELVTYYDVICSFKREYENYDTMHKDKWNIGQIGQMLAWNISKTRYVIIEASMATLLDYYINKCGYIYGYPNFRNRNKKNNVYINIDKDNTTIVGRNDYPNNDLFQEFIDLQNINDFDFSRSKINENVNSISYLQDFNNAFKNYIELNNTEDFHKLYNSDNDTFLCYQDLNVIMKKNQFVSKFKDYYENRL